MSHVRKGETEEEEEEEEVKEDGKLNTLTYRVLRSGKSDLPIL